MRYAAVCFSLLLLPAFYSAGAQDAGAAAAQAAAQAQQMAQQANEQAALFAQQAAQQANQNLIDASNNATAAAPYNGTRPPGFSLKEGAYPGPVTIRLSSKTHHARIFYTTDGWTPTTSSTPYTGPLTLTASTELQAIAIAPGYMPSIVAASAYRIASAPPAPETTVSASPLTSPESLAAGTPVLLRFPQPLTSETAYVGQPIQLALAQDLVVDGHLLAPIGTPANAIVTEADHTGRVYQAGVLSFALKSMLIHGVEVPLSGTRTREGTPVSVGRASLFLIPVVGPLTILKHGAPAEIPVGAELQGSVAATSLIPPAAQTP